MSTNDASGLGSGSAYEAARLRWAGGADAERLVDLWREAGVEEATDDGMAAWLEHGGALMLEDEHGRALCALRWRWDGDGWRIDPIVTHPDARGRGFGRWLMTKVEALAIKRNVPTLTLELRREDRVGYYRRLGYHEEGRSEDAIRMVKRVGGVWQRQPGSVA